MTAGFVILAVLTVASAVAAMTVRNLVHCALAVAIAFAGLAAIYLQLSAQFVGFAQLLVYVGAIAILIVFAILLTRSGEPTGDSVFSRSWVVGAGVAVGVFGVLAMMICSSRLSSAQTPVAPEMAVRDIGVKMMSQFILPLEVIGLLLTAALIGAVLIAMRQKEVK